MNKNNVWSVFISTFLFLIVSGSIVLMIPGMYKGNLHYIDALFTSTSAVCVTGLVVTNTSNFTLMGQIVIITLIQLGGLGIMVLTTSLLLFLRGELDLQRRVVITSLIDVYALNEAEYVLRYIVLYTFFIEIIGAIFLTIGFLMDGHSLIASIFHGVFHSVSAFCNAGFSPFDDSIIGMNWLIKVSIMLLIIFGGLGFYVIYDLHNYFKKRDNKLKRLKVHTKIVLITTACLIMFGVVILSILEHDMSLLDGFFQSVSARTAGFNSVDLTKLTNISKFALIILMFIGASPGGTGGGIKTSTFAIMLLSIKNILKGDNRILLFNREVHYTNILKSFSITAMYIFILIVATLLMLYFYNYDFMDMLFEVASALGTVGLSLGITMKIGLAGKIILIICMFVGRIGVSALVLSLVGYEHVSNIRYPEEKVILG
ncbi:MAG: potassium transporter [Calditerrivibrio nitroreducens]|uniref:Potassium transporter n=1 Tax=Calditerrivibrio nitroreducens TaxID=477976 RepID=A0A2J6WJN0_9BACT|nr:MAG: potassium transporter [Calditerrivibrio nitroreducens]